MKKIKLVTIDVDETLLNSQHQIVPSTITAVKKAAEQGVKVVICSGRPPAGVAPFLEQLGLSGNDQYVITYNGGVIETISGNIVQKHVLPTSDFEKFSQFSNKYQVNFNVLDDHSQIYTTNHQINWFTVVQANENEAGLTVLDPTDLPVNFTLVKSLFTGPVELLDQIETPLKAQFGEGYYIVRSSPVFLEVLNAKASKGQATSDLAQYLDLQKDEIMAIGDERNDLSMFEVAGTSIAMGNAHAAVKEAATFVTSDNDHDGIAEAFEKFVF
ncbi:Cof-type HAD-IIB family hydrolase [Xylocopilactobacillus apicola]|uniref:Hydrolase n=1 Tax=Xylocopilactobacillus apicola TaxID=2932184 RepID=A0AAU9DDB1_9LACO|nr:Cof-type HAD-IIB family hydrolase [Xylocopilactobacillus apicola]BDR57795.1 hydrolase [Xylocopilactobacillus apicola]